MPVKKKTVPFGVAGGKATLKKYGREHFSKLAKKMHAKRKRAMKQLLAK